MSRMWLVSKCPPTVRQVLAKQLQTEPSQHKHLFLVVVLWINSVYGYHQSKAWLLWFRQVCWLCFQLMLWLLKALLAFLPHQFHKPRSWKDQCVSLRSLQLCSSIKLKSKSLWNPMMGNKGAQSCSTEPIKKKKSFQKTVQWFPQILSSSLLWGISQPQLSGYFHYLLKSTMRSNTLLPPVLFSR